MLVGLFLFSLSSWALEVITIGEGGTRQEAINNAIINAVEEALGTYITSSSQVDQGKLIYDRITSASAGYVKSYKVLAESHDPVTDTYKVKLTAVVDDIKLKNAVEEFMQSPQFQRTFQQTKFDERRVVVVYKPRTELDLPYNSRAVQSVMDLIEDKLAGYGFRVFLPDQLIRIRSMAAEMVVDEETAVEIARQEAGDAVVVVSFDAGKRPTMDGYYIIYATLTLKAYDATTGELFGNVQDKGKIITRGGEYGLADGVARIAIKIGPRCVDKLTEKIVTRFSGSRTKFAVLIFRNVSPGEQDKIEDILGKIGWRYRISRQTGSYMEVEVFSEADPTSVRQIMLKRLKTAGLSLIPVKMAGSRVIFEGAYSGLRGGY
ncbi:MAG: hypothetical protein J7K20_06380 [Thermodesulfobacterium sp.]|nr:hypothetical protein [Thermodesulfobacterium sp.]